MQSLSPLIASIVALIIAIWGDNIRRIFIKPFLIFSEVEAVPQINSSLGTTHMMLRLAVKNKNNFFTAPARNLRASITYIKNGEISLPMPLTWTHIEKDSRDISKGEVAYLDVIKYNPSDSSFYRFHSKMDGLIGLPEYFLSRNEKTEIRISFFEENSELKTVRLELNPKSHRLKVISQC